MKNSERNFSPEKSLKRIFNLLKEERIAREVDDLLDTAVQEFQMKATGLITYTEFKRIIASFVRHIYKKGLRQPSYISDQEAFTEAVHFLEKGCLDGKATEFDAALLDVIGKNAEGFKLVFYRLAESIKKTERGKYTRWVFVTNFLSLDWEKREQIITSYLELASVYIRQAARVCVPELLDLDFASKLIESDPASLADQFSDLFKNHVLNEDVVQQLFNSGRY